MEEKAKGFLGGFKEFISRGNVLDMAIGIVVGAAFTAIVTALVSNIIMPIIGYITKGVSISTWSYPPGSTAEDGGIMYGMFIEAVVTFFIIAFVVFLLVKVINNTIRKPKEEAPPEPDAPSEVELLQEIRDLLKEQRKAS